MSAHTPILDAARQAQLDRVRTTLEELRSVLSAATAAPADEATLRGALEQLDDVFLLVVVGEFNAGKSALINALLGERLLEEGVTPTTTAIQIIRHADDAGRGAPDGVRIVSGSSPLLRDVHLVDTPGTNAIATEHTILTEEFVPRADLILFATSADRALTESERSFIGRIREWGKKVVVIINKVDLLSSAEDLETVVQFVTENLRALLGSTPQVFPVSARDALAGKTKGDTALVDESGLAALEQYILDTLDDDERFRLKLLNPIGVSLRIVQSAETIVAKRREVLAVDLETTEEIRSLLTGYEQSLHRGLELRLAEVDGVLRGIERNGDAFFEETVRVGRVFDLLNRSKVRADFEREVIGNAPTEIEKRVEGIIDWLVKSDLDQWKHIRDRLVQRKTEQADHAAGRLAGGFDYDRDRLLDAVGGAVQKTLDQHDHRAESARVADSVQGAVANAALLEVGAVGLGAVISMITSSTAVDVTGTLAASVMATLGFFVIPRRRRQAKRELRSRVTALQAQLRNVLTAQLSREVTATMERVEAVLAPYLNFVEGERTRLEARAAELSRLRVRLEEIKRSLDAEVESAGS